MRSIEDMEKVCDMIDPKSFAVQIGERMANVRRNQGLSQTELAKLCDLSQQMVADYESGRRRIPACNLAKIAEALTVPAARLLDGVEVGPRKRGPAPRFQRLLEQMGRLPKPRQRFVVEMLENALK
jgi:transcriptional regulator with XRE-family HTH domain